MDSTTYEHKSVCEDNLKTALYFLILYLALSQSSCFAHKPEMYLRVGSPDVPVGDNEDKDMAQAVEDDGNIHQRTEVPSDGSILIKMEQKPINTARKKQK